MRSSKEGATCSSSARSRSRSSTNDRAGSWRRPLTSLKRQLHRPKLKIWLRLFHSIIGIMQKNMETTIVCWGYIGIMEKYMETTIWLFLNFVGPSSAVCSRSCSGVFSSGTQHAVSYPVPLTLNPKWRILQADRVSLTSSAADGLAADAWLAQRIQSSIVDIREVVAS